MVDISINCSNLILSKSGVNIIFINIISKKILHYMNLYNTKFSIMICDNILIKELNKKFRNKDCFTDVLSFPSHNIFDANNAYLGDIAISLEYILENSNSKNYLVEFVKLLIHGVLHLVGYDHEISNFEYERMLTMENKIFMEVENLII